MTLQEDMDSKRSWTQGEINALKSKYKRTHFTHFSGQTSQAYRENYDRIFRKRKRRKKKS